MISDMPTMSHAPSELEQARFAWLHVTNRCQERCLHCYASSGPDGEQGSMTADDWRRVIDQASAAGVEMVQFIGGEPALRPDLVQLAEHALGQGLEVEVYTNLFAVTPKLWDLYTRPGVRVATSYYSDDPAQHDAITTRPGSHTRTRAHIVEALRRGVRLRVGLIDLGNGQRVEQAYAELQALGVEQIGVDRVRAFGRGSSAGPDESQTCGQCGHGAVAIGPDGMVSPCVFTTHLSSGDLRQEELAAVLAGERWRGHVARLDGARAAVEPCHPCLPAMRKCGPDSRCLPACAPTCPPLKAPPPKTRPKPEKTK